MFRFKKLKIQIYDKSNFNKLMEFCIENKDLKFNLYGHGSNGYVLKSILKNNLKLLCFKKLEKKNQLVLSGENLGLSNFNMENCSVIDLNCTTSRIDDLLDYSLNNSQIYAIKPSSIKQKITQIKKTKIKLENKNYHKGSPLDLSIQKYSRQLNYLENILEIYFKKTRKELKEIESLLSIPIIFLGFSNTKTNLVHSDINNEVGLEELKISIICVYKKDIKKVLKILEKEENLYKLKILLIDDLELFFNCFKKLV